MPKPTPVRVLVLTKRHRLSDFLIQELARDNVLAGVLLEERFRSPGDTLRYLRRNARREGVLHTVDVVLYELWDRAFRRGRFDRHAAALLPLNDPPPAAPVPTYVVEDLNSAQAHAIIDEIKPDLLVVHACGILKEATFGRARVAALNIHCGVLPEYRGHASTFWSMYRGDVDNVGVTVHLVAKLVDTGLPVGIARVPVSETDDDISMWMRAFRAGVDIVREAAVTVARDDTLSTQPYEGRSGPHYVRRGLTQHLWFISRVLPALRRRAARSAVLR